jgi:hypothetical protein
MFWWFFELLSSLKFLAITGDRGFFQSKRVYELLIPLVVALCLFSLLKFCPQIFSDTFLKEFSTNLFQLMVFVIPFHLAALAALTTYQAKGLDEKLGGTDALLRVWSNTDGDYFYKDVTIRQYASLLFGYLCSIGIGYVLVYLFTSSMKLEAFLGSWFGYVHGAALFAAIFFVVHYGTLTIYAVTFLFDKANSVRSV